MAAMPFSSTPLGRCLLLRACDVQDSGRALPARRVAKPGVQITQRLAPPGRARIVHQRARDRTHS
jgi:hypothetical protein